MLIGCSRAPFRRQVSRLPVSAGVAQGEGTLERICPRFRGIGIVLAKVSDTISVQEQTESRIEEKIDLRFTYPKYQASSRQSTILPRDVDFISST